MHITLSFPAINSTFGIGLILVPDSSRRWLIVCYIELNQRSEHKQTRLSGSKAPPGRGKLLIRRGYVRPRLVQVRFRKDRRKLC